MKLKSLQFLLLGILLVYGQSVVAADKYLVMPKELVVYGQKHNCQQIDSSSYYGTMGNYGPPYVYGVTGKQTDDPDRSDYRYNSAAFWCVSKNGNTDIMIFFRKKPDKPFPCATKIPVENDQYMFPLTIVERKWNLRDFYRLDGKKEQLKGVFESRAIVQGNDYFSTTAYVCYKGNWIYDTLAEG